MSDTKTPSISWPTPAPGSHETGNVHTTVNADLKELEEIVQAAGGFPDSPDTPLVTTTATAPGVPPLPSPVDIGAERQAFADLLAFIAAEKDPGTTVTAIDPDAFAILLSNQEGDHP